MNVGYVTTESTLVDDEAVFISHMLFQFVVIAKSFTAPFAQYRLTVLKVMDVITVLGEVFAAVCAFESWRAGRLIIF